VTCGPLAAKNGNRLTVSCLGDLSAVWTDGARVRQILLNLIGNACKFTHGGTVDVSATTDAPEGCRWLMLRVSDTGIGITRDQLATLFQPFAQADEATWRRYGGTGLGLAICKRLSEMLGGTIHVESVVGLGSTFTVRLPAGPLAAAGSQAPAASSVQSEGEAA
jgi:signal transduction histidine kinase